MKNIRSVLSSGFVALTATSLVAACGGNAASPDAKPGIDAAHGIDGATRTDAGSADARPVVAVPYGLNDVSILLPIPSSLDDSNALSLSSAGNGGALLSLDNFNAIQPFPDDGGPGDIGGTPTGYYDRWRVVSARIDPCFPDLALLTTNPTACRRQLRLVAQPFTTDQSSNLFEADDDAIHLLYDLSADDFTAMATQFLSIGDASTHDASLPLGVHPIIAQQGLGGSAATTLRATILAYAGATTLSQYTFVQGRFADWQFGAFRIINGVRTPIAIHGLGTSDSNHGTLQETDVSDVGIFGMVPSSAEDDALAPLAGTFSNPSGNIGGGMATLTASPTDIAAAMQKTFDLETPSMFNAGTLDCSGCHAAGRVRIRGIGLGATTTGTTHYSNEPFNLELKADSSVQGALQQQRAFGYNLAEPVWNQRVINESAAIAVQLGIQLPH